MLSRAIRRYDALPWNGCDDWRLHHGPTLHASSHRSDLGHLYFMFLVFRSKMFIFKLLKCGYINERQPSVPKTIVSCLCIDYFKNYLSCVCRCLWTKYVADFVAFEGINMLCFSINCNCEFVGSFHIFYTLCFGITVQFPEIRIWSILLIKSDLKWCIHLSRSLLLYFYSTVDKGYGWWFNVRNVCP